MKAPRADGHVYVSREDLAPIATVASDERLQRILSDIPVTIGRSGLILVLTGTPGTASVIAQAIDESTLHEQEGHAGGRQYAPRPLRRRGAPRALARPLRSHRGRHASPSH